MERPLRVEEYEYASDTFCNTDATLVGRGRQRLHAERLSPSSSGDGACCRTSAYPSCCHLEFSLVAKNVGFTPTRRGRKGEVRVKACGLAGGRRIGVGRSAVVELRFQISPATGGPGHGSPV